MTEAAQVGRVECAAAREAEEVEADGAAVGAMAVPVVASVATGAKVVAAAWAARARMAVLRVVLGAPAAAARIARTNAGQPH